MAIRNVERELQFARLDSVSTNRPMRVRLDCPQVGQIRSVGKSQNSTVNGLGQVHTDP
jgi:hypothetical protein